MKKIYKRVICILIILSMLIMEYPNINTVKAASEVYPNADSWYENSKIYQYYDSSHTSDYDKDKVYMAKLPSGQPMPRYITRNGINYYLNHKIYLQKNLYVYGNYNSVAGNYFKCGYQVHEDLTQLEPKLYYGNGYFLKPSGEECLGKSQNTDTHTISCIKHADGTIRGEWKYFGFDVNGNLFSNMWMINVKTETKFVQRDWQLEPWSTALNKKTGIPNPSLYNSTAYGGIRISETVSTGVQNWIAETVNTMDKYSGIPTKNSAYPSGFSMHAYKFMYVQSPPTIKKSGSGRMWHDRDGVLWYQTFSVPILKNKEHLPVKCTIAKTSMPNQLPNGTELDDKVVKLEFEVSGILADDVWSDAGTAPTGWIPYYNDEASKTVKYTRYDLESWKYTLNIESLGIAYQSPNPISHANKDSNITKTKVEVETTVKKLKTLPKNSEGKYEMFVAATADPTYKDATRDIPGTGSNKFAIDKMETKVIEIPTIEIKNHIGEIAFDGVSFDDATDSTDMTPVKSTELYINGQAVNYNTFFVGQYTFPATTDKNGYFAEVVCKYNLDKSKMVLEGLTEEERESIENTALLQYVSVDYVYVYTTKPIAQYALTSNSWKQNRIINVTNTSARGNIQLVLAKYPITEYSWSYGGDTTKLNYGTNTDMIKQLQYKTPGTYSLTLECKNTLGKWSEPYTVEYQVLEDYSPNIEVNLSDSVLTRNDELSAWHYDMNSTDGDKVALGKIELWYDANNDKILDTKVQEWNGLGDNGICELNDFPKYTPIQLGYYKYKLFAKDEFVGVVGQDTLTQYITDADKKEETYEVEFWVDNYQPLSDVYIDAAIERPNVDLFIMGDKGLPQDKLTYLSDNRVVMENTLLGKNILPSINIWNMKTYEYSTPASTTQNTGTSYPSGSVPYTSAGYSGTLPRTNVIDNGSYYDFGHTATKTETKTAYGSGTGYGWTYYRYTVTDAKKGTGSWSSTGSSSTSQPTQSYSDGAGYSGTLSCYSSSLVSDTGYPSGSASNGATYTQTRTYSASYSGTVSRTVSYWVPDVRWVANYTGNYNGTIYKYVRQPYTNPWRANSSKYILYISDGNISELADFTSTLSKTDAKVILAGTSIIQLQSPSCAKFIDVTGKSIQEIVNEAMTFISNETPSIEQVYVLPNQTFTLNYGEDDLEGDAIVSREMQYVHDKAYFDNPTGQEPNTQTNFSNTSGWNTIDRSSFTNVGKYQIYRRVKDKPTGAYGDDYSYYSGATEVDIYVHRKPIALASLDWDFDSGTNIYKTTWVDQSYDLDHNISRSYTDKGIAQRKIMWRKDGGEWNYTIPDSLSPGVYNLRYYVKDIENTWSDVFTINIDGNLHSNISEVTFTLATSPPMQFEARIRSEKEKFRTSVTPVTLPASENLELTELWTRYPSTPILTMAIFKENGSQVSTTKTVSYSTATGTKNSNDINWNNILYNTSKTLTDGNYIFKISATSNQSKTISFPIILNTPINLKGFINGKINDVQVNTGEVNKFTFTTSTYVNSTKLIFEGNTYLSELNQIKLISDDGTTKTWEYNIDIAEGAYPDGKLGTATFIATIPSGKSETTYVNYKVVGIRATNFIITMMLDLAWRAYYFDVNNGIDENHDGINDKYPRRTNTDIGTTKLPINNLSLVGFPRGYIKAGYKVKGKIDIQGNPDSAYFKISHYVEGIRLVDNVFLTKSSTNTYVFEWIIPLETDSKSLVHFDLVTTKGSNIYGNEKWVDVWDYRNTNRDVFYVKGNALEDITFVQSH